MQVADGAVTTQSAAYAANTQYSDLPTAVRHETHRSVFNSLGCMLGGAGHEGSVSPTRPLAPAPAKVRPP